MARKKMSGRDDDEEVAEPLPDIPGAATMESAMREEREIDDVLSEVGSAAAVKIYRVNPETGNAAYAGTIKGDDFSLDTLTDVYGGGAYILRVFSGKNLLEKVRVEVDSSIPARNPRAPRTGVAVAGGPGDAMAQLMLSQAESSKRQIELMTTVMAGITTAFTSMAAVKHEPAANPLELLRTAVELVRPQSPTKSAVSELKDLLEISDMVRGNGNGGDDGTMRMVGKAIDTVGEIVRRNPPAVSAVAPMRPMPVPLQPPIQAALLEQKPVAPVVEEIPVVQRPWIEAVLPHQSILRFMVGNLSAGLAAEAIAEKLDDVAFGDLILDVTEGIAEGGEVSAEKVLPFAVRTQVAFNLPATAAVQQWLSEVAVELVLIANSELGDDEDAPEAIETPKTDK